MNMQNFKHRLSPLGAVAVLVLAAPTTVRAQAVDAEGSYVKGRVIVQARAGLPDHALAKIVAAHGGVAKRIGSTDLHVVQLPAGTSETTVRGALARNPMLKFAQLDRKFKLAAAVNDPYAANAWHLPNIGAPAAWDTATGAGVTIAILDTGVDGSHPDLAAQMVPGWNMVNNNSNTSDAQGHGTAVAGAAAAALNNGIGVASVAGFAKIMPIRVVDDSGWASASTIAQGLTFAADRGAKVANISISNLPGDSAVQSAAKYMKGKGGLVVVAAGNSGQKATSVDETTMIVVSATETNDTVATWSSYGNAVRVAAPGNYIYTTTAGGGYGQWWGTSFASPVAAGVVALIMSTKSGLSNAQVENILISTATDLGTAGRDIYYGYGKVNAAAAVAAAAGTNPTAADVTAPTVALASPLAGSTVTGIVAVDATAADNVGVSRVDLLVDGVLLGTDASGPYQFAWDSSKATNGTHSLEAVAYDAAGNSTRSGKVFVTASNVTNTDVTPPVVAILNPNNGSAVSGTVSVGIQSSDDAGAATLKNTLFINGVAVASGTGSTLTYKWNTRKLKAGTHTLQAQSVDGAGNRTSTSIQVSR